MLLIDMIEKFIKALKGILRISGHVSQVIIDIRVNECELKRLMKEQSRIV